ncbi:MAG: HYR domain-containing protein, partial [Flavobacteriaceae bacterium]|nr:HYR domain-containing protein [Flavobacteriaceae bacterium]
MRIYDDAGGVPGAQIFTESFPGSLDANNDGDFILDPTGVPDLTAGTKYWLNIQAQMNFGTSGQWFWDTSSDGSDSPYAFQNPGGGFGTGCATWSPHNVCGLSGAADLLMDISFNAVGGGPVAECGTGNPQPIPASGTGNSACNFKTISPANVTATGNIGTNPGDYTLDSVQINLTHTWDSDLDISLISPLGTTLDLSSDNGGSGDNYTNTVFMDGFPSITTGTPPFTGTFQAEGGTFAAKFAGQSINGNWTLSICDDAGGDSGTLLSYCINFSQIPIVIGNPPVIACPADPTIASNSPGLCSAVVNFAGAAFDVEDGNISGSIIATPPSGSVFPVGDTLVTLSVTDSDGNTATCSFTVTVQDTEAPVAICQDITVDLDASGMATITAAQVNNASTDNCGIASMSLNVSSFDCADVGANTVILTVTDNSGNSSTCTSTVTVQDVTAPDITCIGGVANVTESEDFEGATIPTGWTTNILVGSWDWTFGSGAMPGGPDFPTNAAIFDDDAAGIGNNNVAELLSPVYDLSGATTAELSFDYSLQDIGGLGLLLAEVWDGAAWQQILLADNADIPPVNTGVIDVLPYANAAFQVKFTWDDETGWNWGAGVDNFLLNYEVAAGGGLDVYLDANGLATVDPNLLVTVNEACGYTVTAGGGGGGTTGSLTTLFASGNNGSQGGAVYFDITVGPSDLEVTDIDINTADPGSFTMNIYTLVGTYVGNESNPGAWGAAVATASGTGAGIDTPSNAVLASSIILSANTTYGMALVLDGTHGHYYTNGNGSNQNYSNADMSMALGSASNVPFTAPTFSPRVFNGAIHYITGGGGGGLDFTCADLGVNLVEVTVTDASGNVSTCMATVNVIDNIAPVITCGNPTVTTTETEDFESGLPAGWSTIMNTGTCNWINSSNMPTGDDFPTLAMLFDDDACGSGAPASNVSLLSAVYDISGATSATVG